MGLSSSIQRVEGAGRSGPASSGAPFSILEFEDHRLGHRVTNRLVVGAFLLDAAGGLARNYAHGDFGVRLAF
jgi:hypothetical protein